MTASSKKLQPCAAGLSSKNTEGDSKEKLHRRLCRGVLRGDPSRVVRPEDWAYEEEKEEDEEEDEDEDETSWSEMLKK